MNYTISLVKKSKIIHGNVWVIFDKDNFKDFDDAIKLAENQGFKVGWSNQCFEYWLYLHFYYNDSALDRKNWFNKMNEIFKEQRINKGKYVKNLDDIFELVGGINGVNRAIKNADKIMGEYSDHRVVIQELLFIY